MNIIIQALTYLSYLCYLIGNIKFFLLLLIIVISYHFILYFTRDKSYYNAVRKFKDPEKVTIDNLKEIPLVNIIIPAWKEGKEFKDCLYSITKLTYPKLKVIVNAGGSEETTNIANSFKRYNNFIILHQIVGQNRPTLGKIKALNDCLGYVSEGILYLIDADCYLTDEILFRMIFPIINLNENVVIGAGVRPLSSQENIYLVKYIHLSQFLLFKRKFTRYNERMVSGANTCLTYETIKAIGKFSENRMIAEDLSRGIDILNKGFKIYALIDYRSRIYTDTPISIYQLYRQRKKTFEDILLYSYKSKKFQYIIKIIFLIFISIYVVIFPLFLLFNFGLFFIGLTLFFDFYLNRIRRYLFFRQVVDKKYYRKFPKNFFIRMLYYIYIESILNVFIFFELVNLIILLKKGKMKR